MIERDLKRSAEPSNCVAPPRFDGVMAAVDDAVLAATRAEITEGLDALGIDAATAAARMRARIEAAVRERESRR